MLFPSALHLPPRTITGERALYELVAYAQSEGRGLIIHGMSFHRQKQFKDIKAKLSKRVVFYPHTSGEPTLQDIRDVIEYGKKKKVRWIAGIGGGSILDLAKASAGLFRAGNDPAYYQEGNSVEGAGLPFIAVPTTAGSGAEATINAVIINEKTREKKSIRSSDFMAKLVLLDPELIRYSPPEVIAWSGMDAIVQAIESYYSRNATDYTRFLALTGFTLLTRHIQVVYDMACGRVPWALNPLQELLTGSYLTAMAFTNSRLGVVHGIAHPLGAYYEQPHGLVCALCLIPALKINHQTPREEYAQLSAIVRKDLISYIDALLSTLKIPQVFSGQQLQREKDIIDYTLNSGSTKANPKTISEEDVRWILEQIFQSDK